MLIVEVRNRKDGLDKALKELKRKTIKTRQIKELRERQQFIKPSVKKRAIKIKAAYKQKLQSLEE
jgi:small subunit ribosomal protein S21